MRVLFATAEFARVVSAGGLASASAGLVGELRRQGVEVDVVMPDYGGIELRDEDGWALDVPEWAGPAHVRRGEHAEAGTLHLVGMPRLARPHPYLQPDGAGWEDNDHRFLAFSQAVAALAHASAPDVLHLNDWHTAATLAALEPSTPTVLSIHNLAYQGVCDPSWLARIGPRARPYGRLGACNPMAGGLELADAIVAVSPTYASEIVQPAHGCGLDALLAARGGALVGIRNGIDVDVWDPRRDGQLPVRYGASTLGERRPIRTALRRELGLPESDVALAVMVTRLTDQKGVDLALSTVPFLERLPLQLAVLGSGDASLAEALRQAAGAHPETVAFVEGYDEGLSHRLFGGGDLLLMPSRFEPCGLAQMQAMRYGAIPVVTPVGGLLDTVVDADEHEGGTGFVAVSTDALGVLDALHRAVRRIAGKGRRQAIQKRGMAADWSWRVPAERHLELYRSLVRA